MGLCCIAGIIYACGTQSSRLVRHGISLYYCYNSFGGLQVQELWYWEYIFAIYILPHWGSFFLVSPCTAALMEISFLLHDQPLWQVASDRAKIRVQMTTSGVTEPKTLMLPLQWNVAAAVQLSFLMLFCSHRYTWAALWRIRVSGEYCGFFVLFFFLFGGGHFFWHCKT